LRLAFAVSTSVDADIIVMDEWLSVGDADFNEKAAKRLKSFVDNASILVIATHSEELLKNVCNRAFRLEHGQFVDEFDPRVEAVA
jgi:lipopolysaccharide transport system ATP-binding protein